MVVINQSIDAVLLPTDGSDGALAGAAFGIELAGAVDADIHVLSVIDTSESGGGQALLESTADEERTSIEAAAEEAVERVATKARDWNAALDVTTVVERGVPSRVIGEYADEHADLVVMGTMGRTGLERFVPGSVTESVLRTSQVPVLAVPPERDELRPIERRYDTILFPTDGSEGAAAALEWAVFVATESDAMLHSLYSVDTSRYQTDQQPSEMLTRLERRGEEALETVRERAREAEVSLSGSITSGPPADVILAYVERHDVDLIVMGTHGRSSVTQRILGSVTENVVRQADIPVLCVPRDGA